MTLKEFRPHGVTGTGEASDMFYRHEVTGPEGARYTLLRERHHIVADTKRATEYLRKNFDCMSIRVEEET